MIRDLKQKDIDKVMEIWLESTIKAHDFIPEKYWQDNYNAVKDIYIPQSKTYVYEEGEEIKGFISILNDDFIGALFVSMNEQGKGIGSKLIEYANAKFDNLKLAVYKQNQKSVGFYIKKGFEILSGNLFWFVLTILFSLCIILCIYTCKFYIWVRRDRIYSHKFVKYYNNAIIAGMWFVNLILFLNFIYGISYLYSVLKYGITIL